MREKHQTEKTPVDEVVELRRRIAELEKSNTEKKTLDNLRESEAKYRALFDHANDAIFLLKGDMFVDCNPRTLKTFRCTRTELLSQKIHRFSPHRQPDGSTSKQKILKRIEDALSGEPQYFDWIHRRCDDTSFDAEVGLNRIEIGGETLLLSIVRDVTERKHTETELRASEEKLRTVFDQTFQLMGLLTPDGILLSANRAALSYKGLKDYEVMGKPIWETPWWSHDKKERDRLKDAINRAKEGDTVRYEATQLHLDGTLRYIDFSLRPSKNEKGVIIYLIAEGHDITAMKEKEEALRQAEAKYRAIFENADMGIYQTTRQGRIVNANPALARILGYDSPRDLIESISDVVTQVYVNPKDRMRVIELCRDPGFVERFETIFYKKDKSKVWVSINSRPIKDPEGNIMYFEGTIEDITERKMTEKNLQESEEKYRSVVESSFVGFYIIQDRVFRFVNKGFCEITGYGYDEVVDRDALNIVHPGDRKMVESYIEKRITGQTSHVEYLLRVIKKDGHITHVKIFGSSLVFNGRRAAAGTMIDVTREKDLEQQLLRTQKLEAIGTLAGGIAHDFNNILSGIIGFTEMVQDGLSPDSPDHRRLGLVLKGARRGRDLVKQILTFSRQTEHEQEPVILSEIVNEGLKLLRPILPATIEIRSKKMADDATVLADPIQIHQVLMNLCTNSSHAMGKKGGVLEINVRTGHFKKGDPLPSLDMKPGDYVTLSVHDTGRGMGPETLERIFDPFFTTKTKGEGTGLGLSMVHGIVKSHRGFIKVDSEPGKGSTFYIYLPKIEKQESLTGIGPLAVSGGKERILFVDDEDIIVELNDERLTRLGYEIKATTSNVEALEIFRKEPEKFDLVITDYTMPNMTGMDFAKEILKIRKDIPIILCTGYNDRISADKARKAGIKEFVMKPLNTQDMSAAIHRALGKKPGNLHL